MYAVCFQIVSVLVFVNLVQNVEMDLNPDIWVWDIVCSMQPTVIAVIAVLKSGKILRAFECHLPSSILSGGWSTRANRNFPSSSPGRVLDRFV